MKLQCDYCGHPRQIVYVVRRLAQHVVRYLRCPACKATSKHVQAIFRKTSESSTDFFKNDEKPRTILAGDNAIQKEI